jgi:hypothetical protein
MVLRFKKWLPGMFSLVLLLAAGCMYPEEERMQLDRLPEQVAQVQGAVDAYYRENRVLPYKYTEEDEKLTTKYKVNFEELKGILGNIPPSAFEKGGYFLFVLVDVEKDPKVRLFDLRVNDAVMKVQAEVNGYVKQHHSLPVKEKISGPFYTVDFQKLRMDPVEVPSPYSGENLPLVVDGQGKVFLDYRAEVMKKWQNAKEKPDEETDLRLWLSEDAIFVPAFSPQIQMEGNEPRLLPVEEENHSKK